MTTALVYKSETTGLVDWQAPSESPTQPNIVQLAACLVDIEAQRTIASMDVIVRPTKWKIPTEVSDIHGITTGYALAVGVPESLAVEMLIELWSNAAVRVAYSEPFHARVVRIALTRYHKRLGIDPDKWKAGSAESVQKLVAGHTGQKSATLAEAYQHFYGRAYERELTAMGNVQATLQVYFAIQGKANAEA